MEQNYSQSMIKKNEIDAIEAGFMYGAPVLERFGVTLGKFAELGMARADAQAAIEEAKASVDRAQIAANREIHTATEEGVTSRHQSDNLLMARLGGFQIQLAQIQSVERMHTAETTQKNDLVKALCGLMNAQAAAISQAAQQGVLANSPQFVSQLQSNAAVMSSVGLFPSSDTRRLSGSAPAVPPILQFSESEMQQASPTQNSNHVMVPRK